MADILLPESIQLTLDELVCYYHQFGAKFKCKYICSIIASHHRVTITCSTFKSIFKSGAKQENESNRQRTKRYYYEWTEQIIVIGRLQADNSMHYFKI